MEEALTARAVGAEWLPDRLRDAEIADAGPAILDAKAAAGLALLWAGVSRRPEDVKAAASLYARVVDRVGPRTLSKGHQQAAAQAFFLAGRFDDVARALETFSKMSKVFANYLRADLASPAVVGGPPTPEWLARLSWTHVAHGIEPLAVSSGRSIDLPLFDSLDCRAADRAGGELVSVIVPCFKPGQGLLTSLRSLIAQTWEDLEVIVVDDASGPGYEEWFARAESLDPRIRVLRLGTNGGAYRARNAGVRAARGSIITFQDDDDWSHPRRVELQVARLNESGAVATRSAAVRARPDLTHQWFGSPPVRFNVSSLMLRREAVARIGPFFEIRKGADSEYQDRIVALGGSIENVPAPLAVVRLRQGSLSRGDFTHRWATPERIELRAAYEAWHRTLAGDVARDRLRSVNPPFAIPSRCELDGHPRRLDVVYAADYSAPLGVRENLPQFADLERLARDGRRQALWHMESIRQVRAVRPLMDKSWRDAMQSSDSLTSICRTDAACVQHLVVCDPTTLLINGEQPTDVRVEDVEVWLTPDDFEPLMSMLPVDLLWVSDRCREWWSVRPRWVPAPYLTSHERAALVEVAGTMALGESLIHGLD